jgi:hypothetical protein
MARLFHQQALGCDKLGSPMYARLLARAGDDIARGGLLAEALAGHERDPGPSALALRLAGAVHRIVLEGRAPALAAYYPSVGGAGDVDRAWPEFLKTVTDQLVDVRALLASPPQTNEVGRGAVLFGELLALCAVHPLPVRLLEIGASAGLNLRVDAFRYELADGLVLGDPDSPVVLRRPWTPGTRWPPTDVALRIVERIGCDPDPADPLTDEGRLRLTSYVWPDQLERLARLRGAFDVAARVPAVVERAGAAEFLARHLAEPLPGVLTVVWHSVVWQYLDASERTMVEDVLRATAARASEDAPLAHVAFEPQLATPDRRFAFLCTATVWPGGQARVVAEGQGHGPPVDWR